MLEPKYWRAIYDDTRDAFVVEAAGWHNGEPAIEYRFSLLDDDDSEANQGGLEKWWFGDDLLPEGEFYTFGYYADDTAFRQEVERILTEAKQRSVEENLDYFLAITDVVKERAVEAGLEDDDIFEMEGLFEMGAEDAYLQRPFDDQNRLHDHIKRRKDECWRIHIGPVVDSTNQPLGWAVVVLLYPDLTSAASGEEIEAAAYAQLLDLDHWHDKSAAGLAADVMHGSMFEGERVQNPEYAYMDDSEIFELMSVQMSHEEILAPEWEMLEGDKLRAFVNGQSVLVRERTRWHPHRADRVAEFVQETSLPIHLADHLLAHLLDSLRLTEKFGENSPWHYLDDDSDDEADQHR